jgi:hypothetical protein
MATIDGLGPAGPLRPTERPTGRPGASRAGGGFAVPQQGAAAADAGVVGGAGGVSSLDTLLALQEEADPLLRDRAAKRRSQEMLKALAGLQRALLAGSEADAVALLESLVQDVPVAADPGLAELAAAVTLRARVELARRGR